MITCADAVRQMWEYVEQELSPVDREKVEQHLDFCRRCCGEMEFAEELRRFLAREPDFEVPPAVTERFEKVLQELEATKGEV